MNLKRSIVAVAVIVGLLASSVVAYAASYNITLGRLGGTAITNNVQKSGSGSIKVTTSSVGGGYSVSARVENISNRDLSGYISGFTSSTTKYIKSSASSQTVHLRFKNGTFTPVNVQVRGSWTP